MLKTVLLEEGKYHQFRVAFKVYICMTHNLSNLVLTYNFKFNVILVHDSRTFSYFSRKYVSLKCMCSYWSLNNNSNSGRYNHGVVVRSRVFKFQLAVPRLALGHWLRWHLTQMCSSYLCFIKFDPNISRKATFTM